IVFAGIAVAIWVAPAQAGHYLGLEPVRAGGLAVMRSDLGGIFAGTSLLCGVAAWSGRRSWALAAVSMVGAIIVGRVIGWIASRPSATAASTSCRSLRPFSLNSAAPSPTHRRASRARPNKCSWLTTGLVISASCAIFSNARQFSVMVD